jgi:hypothetical protein
MEIILDNIPNLEIILDLVIDPLWTITLRNL